MSHMTITPEKLRQYAEASRRENHAWADELDLAADRIAELEAENEAMRPGWELMQLRSGGNEIVELDHEF